MTTTQQQLNVNNRKTRNFLIYPSFQLRIILMCMIVSLVAPAILFIFQVHSYNQLMTNGTSLDLPQTHPYFVFLKSFNEQYQFVFLIALLVGFLVCLVLGFLISHRVAGPIVKLRNYFERVAEGEKEHEVSFRKNDFFRDLADAYNKRFK